MRSLLIGCLVLGMAMGATEIPEDIFSCFIYYPSRYLERSGTHSEGQLTNVSMCLDRCLESNRIHNFVCRSVMWKQDTHLCVLSMYNRSQRVEKLRVATRSDIDLYENTCTTQMDSTPVEFPSDWDLVRTTIPISNRWEPTPRPKIKKKGKSSEDALLRIVREQAPFAKTFKRKHQGMGPTRSVVTQFDGPPYRKLKKYHGELAKTFSAPITHSEITVNAQVDDSTNSLFTFPVQPWRLPPIRKNIVARQVYANTVSQASSSFAKISPQLPQPPNQQQVLDTVPYHKAAREIPYAPRPAENIEIQPKPDKPVEKPCFTRYKHRTLSGFVEKTVSAVDQRACLVQCLHSEVFYCASVNYNEIKKVCTLNGGNLHLNDVLLKPSPTEDYYENECNPEYGSQSRANSTAIMRSTKMVRCFESLSDSMLLNFDSKLVENVHSLEQCKSECLKGTKSGHRCAALNWLPNNRGCMLFNIGFDLKLLVQHPTAQFLVNKCSDPDISKWSEEDDASEEENASKS